MKTEREIIREARKLDIIDALKVDNALYTNQIAKKLDVVWPTADRLLQELADEGRIFGNKLLGYSLYDKEQKVTFYDKIKKFLHV